ncbi:MAG: TIGR03016 family PEP-CTERM system-associated outer membrane protein, partial [Steroidobacteraceae bacterium]|nr:TIGR03016 family PEP-CTERM system-associated outer membrane protein [Steroidobacteraceae bacterium]MDW8259600.1 TIGR03016 family PEP-CTERM system-associated outer membrane protein [Gammaproteobacteria bacterium]
GPSIERRAGVGLAPAPLPPGAVFRPRVDTSVAHVSNVELVGEGLPRIDATGLLLAPGFSASLSTPSINTAIDYAVIARKWDEDQYDDLSHRLAANGVWTPLPDWFRVEAQAGYTDTIVDPATALNTAGIPVFDPGNLAEVGTASIKPVFDHRFRDWRLYAAYSYGRVWYLDDSKSRSATSLLVSQDSEDRAARLKFGSIDWSAPAAGEIYYEWDRSEFERALPFEYERVGLDGSVRLTRRWAAVGDIGRESDSETEFLRGGLDSTFWSLGFRWTPGRRTSAEARVGKRFFGDSYLFKVAHTARLLELAASYGEGPTVESRFLSLRDFAPGQLPVALPEAVVGRVSTNIFVARGGTMSVAVNGVRTNIALSGFYQERDYLRTVLGDEQRNGLNLSVARRLSAQMLAEFSASYSTYETFVTQAGPIGLGLARYYDSGFGLQINRAVGSRLTVGAESGLLMRRGDANYEGWWVALRARWAP